MELSLPLPRRRFGRVQRRETARGSRAGRAGYAHALARLPGGRMLLRAALCASVALALLGGGWVWLRHSSLVAVRRVYITGVGGVDAGQVRAALDAAATRMTTLDFNPAALRSAVASYAIVAGVRASASFPHTVHISVSERPPVAALLSDGQRTAVAADGTVLGTALLSSGLPTIDGSVEPASGTRLREPAALAAVTVLGAAPPALARYVTRVYTGPEGLTVALRTGLLVYFGDAARPHAKWLSLARVLASPTSAGAVYVDVRLPERPAAGFSTSTSTASTQAAQPTTEALAASLEAALGVAPATSSTPAEPSSAAAGETASAPGEVASGSPSGTSPGTSTEAAAQTAAEPPATAGSGG